MDLELLLNSESVKFPVVIAHTALGLIGKVACELSRLVVPRVLL